MKKRSNRMFIEKDLVRSRAWMALGGVAPQVYMIFRTKCQYDRRNHSHNWSIANNGEIYFPYAEAKGSYGVTAPRFRRAIDDLIDKGFIDIASTGMGVHKVLTYYAISERWRSYGEPTFVPAKRPKSPISNMGFRPGNQLSPRRKSSDENVHGAVNENVVPTVVTMNKNVEPETVLNSL